MCHIRLMEVIRYMAAVFDQALLVYTGHGSQRAFVNSFDKNIIQVMIMLIRSYQLAILNSFGIIAIFIGRFMEWNYFCFYENTH